MAPPWAHRVRGKARPEWSRRRAEASEIRSLHSPVPGGWGFTPQPDYGAPSSDREIHTRRCAFVGNAFTGELGRYDEDSLRGHAALFDQPFLHRLRAAIGESPQG